MCLQQLMVTGGTEQIGSSLPKKPKPSCSNNGEGTLFVGFLSLGQSSLSVKMVCSGEGGVYLNQTLAT
jgi:hypothetical protein